MSSVAELHEAEVIALRRDLDEVVAQRPQLGGAEVAPARRSRLDGSSSNAASFVAGDGEHRFGQGHSPGTGASGDALQPPNDAGALESQPPDAHMLAASPTTKPEQTVLQPEGGPRCT